MSLQLVKDRVRFIEEALERYDVDAFLFLAREVDNPQHMGYDLANTGWVGNTALLITKHGVRKAVARTYDSDNFPREVYEVEVYDVDLEEKLLQVLRDLNVRRVALNYAEDEPLADTLGYGNYLKLERILRTLSNVEAVSGEEVMISAFGRRTSQELKLLKKAIASTERIMDDAYKKVLKPRKTEAAVAEFVRKEMGRHGFKAAWAPDICPIVSVGKNSLYGHHRPGNTKISRGKIVHIDFGMFNGMCSDMQRIYYVLKRGERSAPRKIEEMFEVQVASKAAAMKEMRPGAKGSDVDAAARKVVKDAGFEDFKHGTGHTLARSTHAIGPGLFPLWPTYGKHGLYPLEANSVITVEPSVRHEEIGIVSTEDDVLVGSDEATSLNAQQKHLLYIR